MDWDRILGPLILASLLPIIAVAVLILGAGLFLLAGLLYLYTEHHRLIEHWYHQLACDTLPGDPNWKE